MDFFTKNQKDLVLLANSESGQYLLGIKDRFPVVKVTANSYHQLVNFDGEEPILRATFFLDDRVAQKLITEDFLLEKKLRTPKSFTEREYFAFNQGRRMFLSSTFNPSSGWKEGSNTNDSTGNFSTQHSASTGTRNDAFVGIRSLVSGGTVYICRAFLPFDTSSLTASAIVSASNLQLYRDDSKDLFGNTFTNTDTTTAEIIATTQASGTAYADTDYGLVTFSSKGSLAFSSWSDLAYSTITITTQSLIATTGYTKMAVITGRDLNNSAPTGDNNLWFQNTSDANPPVLTVTYVLGAASASFLINFM